MKKVSICILFDNSITYWQCLFFIERIGYEIVEKKGDFVRTNLPKEYIKTIYGTEIEVIAGCYNDTQKEVVDFAKTLTNNVIDVTGITKYEAYNKLFTFCNHEYICVLSTNVFPQKNWLTEILFYYETVKNSGIVSICADISNAKCVSLVSNEEEHFLNVVIPEDNLIRNQSLYVFKREYLNLVGCYETKLHLFGNEFIHLQLRYFYMLYNNYYIPTQSVLLLDKAEHYDDEMVQKGKNYLDNSIKTMKKQKSFYIPLPIF
jgi:hypothetical protein